MDLLDDVALKGPRTYLQSADLWAAAARRLASDVGPEARLVITFRKLTARRPALAPLEGADRARCVADLRVMDAASVNYALIETDADVTERIDCPEARLLPLIQLGDLKANLVVPDFASPLECVVAATKALHLAQIEGGVKWVVGRLDLPLPFAAATGDRVEVAVTNRLPRQSTLSSIAVNGRPAGTVMFNILR